MLGLAPRGEGFRLWQDGHAAPGGRLPINTNGGGLSFNHSGMYGQQLLVEAYRQLSGTAEDGVRSEEHTSELQSRQYLVCRLLLEKKKTQLTKVTSLCFLQGRAP